MLYFEESELSFNSKEYTKALQMIVEGMIYLKEKKVDLWKTDFLLLRGNIYLAQNKINLADEVYRTIINIDQNLQNHFVLNNIRIFQGKLFGAKKMYKESLKIYETIAGQDLIYGALSWTLAICL